ELNIRELLTMELTELGYDVIAVDSAFNALKNLKDNPFDLVILDIKMPGMDGIEALEKIISTQRSLPVIIHSAYSHFKENYLTWSAAAYVVKSGDLNELKETINSILSKDN
ncbi:MAG: response regulator, partial [Proteobacteria bacterium]|nr:response regulator [Pseudomonadota bacterium]